MKNEGQHYVNIIIVIGILIFNNIELQQQQ